MNKLDPVYEVYTVDEGEEIIVDILRFETKEEVTEFVSGIVGDYKVRPRTMSSEELVDYLLDLLVFKEEHIVELEDKIEELDGALHLARVFIEDTNKGLKSSAMRNIKRGANAKIHPFPVRNR